MTRITVLIILVGILVMVGMVGLGAVPNSPNPQTEYTVYAEGREFRADDVTITVDGLDIMGFWEKIGGRWYYRHYEGLRVRGSYILRERIMRTQ